MEKSDIKYPLAIAGGAIFLIAAVALLLQFIRLLGCLMINFSETCNIPL